MITKIKAALFDYYVGTTCVALVLYAVGGIAYQFGKIKGKAEVADKIHEIYEKGGTITIDIPNEDEAE